MFILNALLFLLTLPFRLIGTLLGGTIHITGRLISFLNAAVGFVFRFVGGVLIFVLSLGSLFCIFNFHGAGELPNWWVWALCGIRTGLARCGVERTGRLIREKNFRIVYHSAHDSDTLCLAAGKLVRIFLLHFLIKPDLCKKFLYPFDKRGGVFLHGKRARQHIVKDALIFKQIDALKNKSAVFSPEHRKLIVRVILYLSITEEYLSESGLIHSRKSIEQGGLTRTRSAHDDGEIALHDLQIEVLDNVLL